MAKLATLFFTLVLLLSLGLIHASRPNAAFHGIGGSSLHGGVGVAAELDEESCEGAERKEECLMRRTLAAHLDYIYTQNRKP
ncbi:hypothetical protein L6164_024561 [Bauhinia variegata]|uniref:Uncharacterized protein n=1 Tax=Bauhinia variegata TaxID=167791 RepID=A0ACB9LZE5_BAUVA|nr:hypothetical protein L6164_024561 [Bauhinia variegata]